MVQLARKKILQNEPLYTGFVMLELSKVLMYDFHYNHIQGQYGADRVRLLFTDTDSLCYQTETDDLYEDMAKNLQHYDTSAYPKTHPLYSPINAKVIGKFKDETNPQTHKFLGRAPRICGSAGKNVFPLHRHHRKRI